MHWDSTSITNSRAFTDCWASELEVCFELPPSGLRQYDTVVPLPVSDFEEQGLYYILAKASLRKLMMEVADTVGLTCKHFQNTLSKLARLLVANCHSSVWCSIRTSRHIRAPEAGGWLVPASSRLASLSHRPIPVVRLAQIPPALSVLLAYCCRHLALSRGRCKPLW